MTEGLFTRRTFLAGAAGAAALVGASGLACCSAPTQKAPGATKTAHVLCAGCPHECGYTAYIVDGEVTKLIGDEGPAAARKLCAEGYGMVWGAASTEGRIAKPLKRTPSGSFDEISWDEAVDAIATAVNSIVAADGPKSLALVHGSRATEAFYGRRFMNALGSANVYDADAFRGLSKASGFMQVIGRDAVSDYEHADAVLIMGASALEAMSPGEASALQHARQRGAEIIYAGPRMSNASSLATRWVPVKPGTELAFVLGMTGALVRSGRYDADFVAANVEGFESWRAAAFACTPEWAEGLCGVASEVIESVANELAQAAPAASISLGNGISAYAGFSNAGELARAAAVFNTLLGCWGKPGGALLLEDAATVEADFLKAVPGVPGQAYGQEDFPLAAVPSLAAALKGIQGGAIKALFVCGTDVFGTCADTSYVEEVLQAAKLVVAIDSHMTRTASFAHYVLPALSFLERDELPTFSSGAVRSVSVGVKAVEPACPDALSVDVIVSKLAQACGVGEYFDFTFEELSSSWLAGVGLDIAGLKVSGTSSIAAKDSDEAEAKWGTPTGRIQFASDACAKAGLSAVPAWVAPDASAADQLRIVGGVLPVARRAISTAAAPLSALIEEYWLDRIWVSRPDAEKLGIADGDTVGVSCGSVSGKARAKVTERIVPGTVFLPDNLGLAAEKSKAGFGLDRLAFSSFKVEPFYGGSCDSEALVTIWKAGM